MPVVYLLKTVYQVGDKLGMSFKPGQPIYLAGKVDFNSWSGSISGAKWFETSDEALEYAFDDRYRHARNGLHETYTNRWSIIEMKLETHETAPDDEKKKDINIRNARNKLTPSQIADLGLT